MSINYRLAFRRLRKNKFIWINILGLALGMAVFMVLFLFLQHENRYEKSHVNFERIYRVEQNKKEGDAFRKTTGVPTPTALVIDEDVSGIALATRYEDQFSAPVKLEDGTQVLVDDIIFADREFLEIFTYPVLYGSPGGMLDQPNRAVISEELSKKLYGSDNSVGQKLKLGDSDIEIQAVIKTLDNKSHLDFSLLISFETIQASDPDVGWYDNWSHGYVLLEAGQSVNTINDQLTDYLQKYQGEESENELYLKPLKEIHLKSEVSDEFALVGSYQNNLIYVIIAILIIIMACINYINLTVAYSASRSTEIGVKRLIGANRFMLVRQLMGESGMSLVIALLLSLIFIEFMLPTFNSLINRQLSIDYLVNWEFYLVFVTIGLLIGLITGLVPAKVISGLKPLLLASKATVSGRQGKLFRYGLVFFQFFITISLISCTLVIFKQYNFLRNTDLGYDKDHVLTIGLSNPDVAKFSKFKIAAEELSWVKQVGSSDYLPMLSTNYTGFTWDGAAPDEFMKMNINYVSPEFTSVYDIKLVKGDGFRTEMVDKEQLYVLLNEKAIKEIGWKDDPVGKRIIWGIDYRGDAPKEAIVAGITEDFHFLSKHQPISPMIMPLLNRDAVGGNLSLKLNPGSVKHHLAEIEKIFHAVYPNELYSYRFADEFVSRMYESEQKMSRLVLALTLIIIFIAIMGLTGLVSYTVTQKTKEIGIRKVNGASMGNIIQLISKDFIILLSIGFVISCPLSWLFIGNWFRNFAYQTSVSWWIFALTFTGMLLISFFTIGLQTIKAAKKNAVEILRYE